jgi:hypothetical protein
MVHTCPRCELRFMTFPELEEHLRVDHHVGEEEPEPRRRYVVVGNQTLSEDAVLDRIAELTKDGEVYLVVPPTPTEPGTHHVDDNELALANARLRHAIDTLRQRGVQADGEVGDPDPVHATAHALTHRHANEIVLSTLPKGLSRWLDVDMPKLLERRFGLPVKVLTASA